MALLEEDEGDGDISFDGSRPFEIDPRFEYDSPQWVDLFLEDQLSSVNINDPFFDREHPEHEQSFYSHPPPHDIFASVPHHHSARSYSFCSTDDNHPHFSHSTPSHPTSSSRVDEEKMFAGAYKSEHHFTRRLDSRRPMRLCMDEGVGIEEGEGENGFSLNDNDEEGGAAGGEEISWKENHDSELNILHEHEHDIDWNDEEKPQPDSELFAILNAHNHKVIQENRRQARPHKSDMVKENMHKRNSSSSNTIPTTPSSKASSTSTSTHIKSVQSHPPASCPQPVESNNSLLLGRRVYHSNSPTTSLSKPDSTKTINNSTSFPITFGKNPLINPKTSAEKTVRRNVNKEISQGAPTGYNASLDAVNHTFPAMKKRSLPSLSEPVRLTPCHRQAGVVAKQLQPQLQETSSDQVKVAAATIRRKPLSNITELSPVATRISNRTATATHIPVRLPELHTRATITSTPTPITATEIQKKTTAHHTEKRQRTSARQPNTNNTKVTLTQLNSNKENKENLENIENSNTCYSKQKEPCMNNRKVLTGQTKGGLSVRAPLQDRNSQNISYPAGGNAGLAPRLLSTIRCCPSANNKPPPFLSSPLEEKDDDDYIKNLLAQHNSRITGIPKRRFM